MAQPSGPLPLLEHHQAACPLHRGNTRFCVKRQQRPEVDDFNFDALRRQQGCGLQGDVNHRTPCHQGDVTSTPNDLRLSKLVTGTSLDVLLHRLGVHVLVDVHPPSGLATSQAVEANVFKEQNRVGEMGPFDQQIVGILWGPRRQHHESGVVGKPRLDHVRVERSRARARPEGYANRHRTISPPTPTKHGGVVHESVETQCSEATELDFDHGFHA